MDISEAVLRSREGDQEAWHQLFDAFYGEVYRAAYLLTRNAALAEEAAQETFVKAFAKLKSLREPKRFPSWLRTIAARCAIDLLRQEKGGYPSADATELAGRAGVEAGTAFQAPERAAEETELRALIRRALAELDPAHRQVIILRFYCDLELGEIAMVMRCPVGTVKSRLHRGLKVLEKLLLESLP
jgi:RNA polymerase sigma-70 factor (ECF subfamily)